MRLWPCASYSLAVFVTDASAASFGRTTSFDMRIDGWSNVISEVLSAPPRFDGEHIIFKPAAGHKQKGILITKRCPTLIPAVIAHCNQEVRSHGKTLFEEWVVQSYVVDPFCVSGNVEHLNRSRACPLDPKDLPICV